MIIRNATQFELRSRWNRHLKQDVLEIFENDKWNALGSLRAGEQSFANGIISNTTLPLSPSRTDCDLQLASTELRESC